MTEFTFTKELYLRRCGIKKLDDFDMCLLINQALYPEKYTTGEVYNAKRTLSIVLHYPNAYFTERIKWLVENQDEITMSTLETEDGDYMWYEVARFYANGEMVCEFKSDSMATSRFRKTIRTALKKAGATNDKLFELNYRVL